VYSPALISQLVEAHVEELHRVAQTYHRGRDVIIRPSAAPLSTRIKRAINRVFAASPAANDEAAPLHGFELTGHSSAATLRPRS
jgi:hypothetical protein